MAVSLAPLATLLERLIGRRRAGGPSPAPEPPIDDVVLRFRTSPPHRGSEDPWVVVHRHGRVQKVGGTCTAADLRMIERPVPPALVERALRLARAVMAFPKPAYSAAAHDPTEGLALELIDGGGTTRADFIWGRASRNDAPLEPVAGDEAVRVFNQLHAVLTAILYGRPAPPEPRPPDEALGEAKSLPELVALLVQSPPTRLSELERVIGPLDFGASAHDGTGTIYRPPLEIKSDRHTRLIRSAQVKYPFDARHDRPYAVDDGRTVRDPGLAEYTLSFTADEEQLPALLEGRCGPGVSIDGREAGRGPGFMFGPFFYFQYGRNLAWYAQTPGWAKPVPSEEVRREWVRELARRLRSACGHDALVAFFGRLPEWVGVRVAGALDGADLQFVFEPGMDAIDFASALDISYDRALAWSGDTHARGWSLHVAEGPDDRRRYVLPRCGPWVIDALLAEAPVPIGRSGVREKAAHGLPPVYDLGLCRRNVVGSVRIAPPRG